MFWGGGIMEYMAKILTNNSVLIARKDIVIVRAFALSRPLEAVASCYVLFGC